MTRRKGKFCAYQQSSYYTLIPILITSAFGNPLLNTLSNTDLMDLGLEDFIQKPYDCIELSEKVARIITT